MASNCDFCGEPDNRVAKMFCDYNNVNHICSVCISIFYHRLKKWLHQERHRMFEEAIPGGMPPIRREIGQGAAEGGGNDAV